MDIGAMPILVRADSPEFARLLGGGIAAAHSNEVRGVYRRLWLGRRRRRSKGTSQAQRVE